MGNKVNLAMQNQFVEFAKKDGEGNIIADAIKQLQEAIGGVVGFKGDLKITTGPDTLDKIPDESGIYRLNIGYAVVSSAGGDARIVRCHAYGAPHSYLEYRGNKGATNVMPYATDDFAFTSDVGPTFDGEIALTFVTGGYKLTPSSYGIFIAKTNNEPAGIAIITAAGPTGYYGATLVVHQNMYVSGGSPIELGHECTVTLKEDKGTQLYKHVLVKTDSSDAASYTIISNTQTLNYSSFILVCKASVSGPSSTPFSSTNQPLFAEIVSAGGTYLHMMYWDSTDNAVKFTGFVSVYSLSTFTDTVTPL